MSKKTRHADNSKRQQPVQQQRAQAAAQATAGKAAKDAGRRADPAASADTRKQ